MWFSNHRLGLFLILCFCFICYVKCENKTSVKTEVKTEELRDYTLGLVEQGRTMVKNTLKRFMLIAPAIFFKLGIAFTMLLLVTLVAVNNGFIGFLILVVGLSSVLARLQGSSAEPLVHHLPVSYGSFHSLPHVSHYHQHPWIDRSDRVDVTQNSKATSYLDSTPQLNSNYDLRNTGVYYKGYSYDQK